MSVRAPAACAGAAPAPSAAAAAAARGPRDATPAEERVGRLPSSAAELRSGAADPAGGRAGGQVSSRRAPRASRQAGAGSAGRAGLRGARGEGRGRRGVGAPRGGAPAAGNGGDPPSGPRGGGGRPAGRGPAGEGASRSAGCGGGAGWTLRPGKGVGREGAPPLPRRGPGPARASVRGDPRGLCGRSGLELVGARPPAAACDPLWVGRWGRIPGAGGLTGGAELPRSLPHSAGSRPARGLPSAPLSP